jgi:RND family efflux transporter MFP subunit
MAVEQKKLIEKGAREEDIEAMKAQVRQAEASLKLARTQAETKTWEKDIALAKSQMEAAQAALRSAEALEVAKSWEAEIIAAKTNATQAKAAFDLAKRTVQDATITAPMTGIISGRYLDLGGKASLGAPLFELVDTATVKAVVSVLESDLSKLKLKDEATIQTDALDVVLAGKVSLISPVLEQAKRSSKVEIAIDNAEMNLKPGMFAKVTIPVQVHENVILIPRSAVIEGSLEDTGTVFVVEDAKSKRREVKFGLSKENVIEVTGGLTQGELVVATGGYSLKDGEEVAVKSIE